VPANQAKDKTTTLTAPIV